MWQRSLIDFVLFTTALTNTASLQAMHFVSDSSLDDLAPSVPYVTSWQERVSLVDCALTCRFDQSCNAFSFNAAAGICAIHRVAYRSPQSLLRGQGWRHFRLNVTGQECPDSDDYVADRLTSTCYRFQLQTSKSWEEARSDCKVLGEDLATLEPLTKAQFVIDYLKLNHANHGVHISIGALRDTTGAFPAQGPDFRWVSGAWLNMTATLPYWVPGRPSQLGRPALALSPSEGFLFLEVFKLSYPKSYICQRLFLTATV